MWFGIIYRTLKVPISVLFGNFSPKIRKWLQKIFFQILHIFFHIINKIEF